jgi:hypothetical protein
MGSLSRARVVTGRRPEERVYLLSPRDATRASVLDVVAACTRELRDRRIVAENAAKEWAGSERRKTPNEANSQPQAA